MRELLILLKL